MSRNIRRRRTIILIIAALAVMFATGVYAAVPKGVTHIDLITSSGETVGESLEIYVGTEVQLSCKTIPDTFMDRKVRYSIADEAIATVDENGLLKALKEGETRLTIECAGTRKNYNVKTKLAVEDITGLDEEVTLYEGEELQLEPKLKMADEDLEKPEITYATKRNTIADVDKQGLITAVKEGETTITVSAGDVEKKVKVTVEARPAETAAPVVTYNNNNSNNNNGGGSRRSGSRSSASSSSSSGGSSSSSSSGGSSDSSSGGGSSDSSSGGGSSDSSSAVEPTNGNGSNTKRTDSDRPSGSSDSGSSEVSTGE